ncbi:MAG: DNA polymerase I, partial [Bacteroidota bacterium]|nr:DNA polymerase I [Bacteroidota bacterium]
DGFEVYMMTPDKDFGQLVSENIKMFRPARFGNNAEVLGVEEICEKFKIKRPEQVIDVLGLWGDAADNIPGIPGVGEKTAQKLLSQFDSIEEMIEKADEIEKKGLRNKVKEHANQALLSKKLATIILDVPVDFDSEKLKVSSPNLEVLKELFDELEFKTFLKRFFNAPAKKETAQPDLFSAFTQQEVEEVTAENKKDDISSVKHSYYLIENPQQRKELIANLRKQKEFCFDTETTGLEIGKLDIIGISFSYKEHEAYYLDLPGNYQEAKEMLSEFQPLFADKNILKIAQNLKFDKRVLEWYDITLEGPFFDTMIAHYLLETEQKHNMDFLAETYLNYIPVSYESIVGKGRNKITLLQVETEKRKDYAAEDADITLQLKKVFEPLLKENKLEKLFYDMEMPLVTVLSDMESSGVHLDKEMVNTISKKLAEELQKIEESIYVLAGEEFNIASPKQLGIILFEKIKVTDNPKKTKTKQYSTGEEVLKKLVNKHPIVPYILEYRQIAKLKSTYVDALPELINPVTGRIHTSFMQTVTATGRLSSKNPNLQNIPIRTERGREVRKTFVPRDENHLLLAADYSQVELRIMAELSQDENMLLAFNNGLDIHSATAARIFGVELDEVTKDMRRKAKTANFGIIYGISAFGLSESLEISRKEASEIINSYFEKYPAIRGFMDKSIEFAKEHGYVETMMQRRRYLRDINSANSIVRKFSERNAINAPIQGTSADMIKIAMIEIYREMKKLNLKSEMILQVHDELVFDVPKEEVEILSKIVMEKMKSAMPLNVPLEVDINTGHNWLEAH